MSRSELHACVRSLEADLARERAARRAAEAAAETVAELRREVAALQRLVHMSRRRAPPTPSQRRRADGSRAKPASGACSCDFTPIANTPQRRRRAHRGKCAAQRRVRHDALDYAATGARSGQALRTCRPSHLAASSPAPRRRPRRWVEPVDAHHHHSRARAGRVPPVRARVCADST